MPHVGIQELVIVFLIVFFLFGARKLPEIARGLGRGIRDFKSAMRETPVTEDKEGS